MMMSLRSTSTNSPANFEEVLELVGWGIYQRVVFIVCGLCVLVQALATTNVFYVLPISICDHKITSEYIVVPISTYFCGMALGGYLLGCFTDCIGRRAVISASLVMVFIGTMGSCFSTSTPMLIISCLITGLAANGASSAGRIFLAEITPLKKRARYLVFMDIFWACGYILGIVIHLSMMPSAIMEQQAVGKTMRLKSWRMIMATGGIACIMQTTLTGLLCRSPRYFLAVNRLAEASETLRSMFALNKSKPVTEFEVPILDNTIDTTPITTLPLLCLDVLPHIPGIMWQLTKSVMKKYLYQTLKSSLVYCLLFYETIVCTLFLAETVKMCAKHHKCFVGTKSFVQMRYSQGKCINASQLPHLNLLVMASGMLLGYIILAFVINLLRRPLLLSLLSFLATVCFSVLASTQIYALCYVAAYLLAAVVSAAMSVFDIALIEMFPTAVRGTANGMVKVFGHMMWCFTFLFLWIHCQTLFIVQGCFMFVGAIAALFLPDFRGKAMQEKL